MGKTSFEDRLIELAGAAVVKEAKQLLKRAALLGVWRDREGFLCGRFRTHAEPPVECRIQTGGDSRYLCACSAGNGGKPCAHAVALIMYSGRFKLNLQRREEAVSYYGGLRSVALPELIRRAGKKSGAEVFIEVASAFPHVPSKWENAILTVKLRNSKRDYLGNLNNLRQLYFDKVLSMTLKLEDFSLQDQQIIRFLALNGEADNSQILLNSELTAEFFFCLIGFPRFSRDGRLLQVRGQLAEAVLIRTGEEKKPSFAPGIMVGDAVLPTVGARVITGRAGCWIGRDGEYFFVPAKCEVSWLRNFFRAGIQAVAGEGTPPGTIPENFSLRVVDRKSLELSSPRPRILLDGAIGCGGAFVLAVSYVYENGRRQLLQHPDGGRLLRDGEAFFRRDDIFEREFESELAMFGFVRHNLEFVTDSVETTGLFLDRVLPEWTAARDDVSFSAGLCRLFGTRSGSCEVSMHLSLLARTQESYIIHYLLKADDRTVEWKTCSECCAKNLEYILVPELGPVRLSSRMRKFFNGISGVIRSLDPVAGSFELPLYSADYFVHLTKDIPGALILELCSGGMPDEIACDGGGAFEFHGELRGYQAQGVRYLQWMTDRNFNVILADEMGLGKTVQLLAFLASRKRRNSQVALVICPASLISNWAREAARFVPDFRVAAPLGVERGEQLKNLGGVDLLILSYSAARLGFEQLRHYKFSYLVLDEAQHIKNPGSCNAKNCKSISARHKIVLTGTPLENSPEDLWSIFDFLQPGMLGALSAFRARYGVAANDPDAREDLSARVAPFIKRRTKAMAAADLPPKTEQIIYCSMEEKQRELYEAVRKEGLAQLASQKGTAGNMTIFSTLLRLRQICCHPALLPEHRGDGVPSAKLELLMELLNQHIDSNHKLLLFSQFTSLLALVIPELKESEIPFEYLDGTTMNRQQRVDHFNNTPEIPLFLLSLKAGGTGLNLTSADTVVIYDPWWNPAVETQAADRTHRIGQTRPVHTIKLVVKDTIEEKILDMQHNKQEIFDSVIENPSMANGEFSLEELRKLLD